MKPKKLNLEEVHRLYLTLKDGLAGTREVFLIDEVKKLILNNSEENFRLSLEILFGKEVLGLNPGEYALLFVRGLKQNSFFAYVEFLNGLKHNG
jgi:hypothetical protein